MSLSSAVSTPANITCSSDLNIIPFLPIASGKSSLAQRFKSEPFGKKFEFNHEGREFYNPGRLRKTYYWEDLNHTKEKAITDLVKDFTKYEKKNFVYIMLDENLYKSPEIRLIYFLNMLYRVSKREDHISIKPDLTEDTFLLLFQNFCSYINLYPNIEDETKATTKYGTQTMIFKKIVFKNIDISKIGKLQSKCAEHEIGHEFMKNTSELVIDTGKAKIKKNITDIMQVKADLKPDMLKTLQYYKIKTLFNSDPSVLADIFDFMIRLDQIFDDFMRQLTTICPDFIQTMEQYTVKTYPPKTSSAVVTSTDASLPTASAATPAASTAIPTPVLPSVQQEYVYLSFSIINVREFKTYILTAENFYQFAKHLYRDEFHVTIFFNGHKSNKELGNALLREFTSKNMLITINSPIYLVTEKGTNNCIAFVEAAVNDVAEGRFKLSHITLFTTGDPKKMYNSDSEHFLDLIKSGQLTNGNEFKSPQKSMTCVLNTFNIMQKTLLSRFRVVDNSLAKYDKFNDDYYRRISNIQEYVNIIKARYPDIVNTLLDLYSIFQENVRINASINFKKIQGVFDTILKLASLNEMIEEIENSEKDILNELEGSTVKKSIVIPNVVGDVTGEDIKDILERLNVNRYKIDMAKKEILKELEGSIKRKSDVIAYAKNKSPEEIKVLHTELDSLNRQKKLLETISKDKTIIEPLKQLKEELHQINALELIANKKALDEANKKMMFDDEQPSDLKLCQLSEEDNDINIRFVSEFMEVLTPFINKDKDGSDDGKVQMIDNMSKYGANELKDLIDRRKCNEKTFIEWSTQYYDWLSSFPKNIISKVVNTAKQKMQLCESFKISGHDNERYLANPVLQKWLPRGISFVSNGDGKWKLTHFAIRKFFGVGENEDQDEDEPQSEAIIEQVVQAGEEQKEAIIEHVVQADEEKEEADSDNVTWFIPTIKANGENFQWSAYMDNGKLYFVIGSKLNKILVPIINNNNYVDTIVTLPRLYDETKCKLLFKGTQIILTHLNSIMLKNLQQHNDILSFMVNFGMTVNFEFEQREYQHLEFLTEDKMVFIGLSSVFLGGITLHPYIASKIGQLMEFKTVIDDFKLLRVDRLDNYVDSEITPLPLKEGFVIYKLNNRGEVVSLTKIKTQWYVIYRKVREKIRKHLETNNYHQNLRECIDKLKIEIDKLKLGERGDKPLSSAEKEYWKYEIEMFCNFIDNLMQRNKIQKDLDRQKICDLLVKEFSFFKFRFEEELIQRSGEVDYFSHYLSSYYPLFYKLFINTHSSKLNLIKQKINAKYSKSVAQEGGYRKYLINKKKYEFISKYY